MPEELNEKMVTAAVLMACLLTVHASESTRKQYCGERLTSKLFALCGGLYNKRWEPLDTGMYTPKTDSGELLNYVLESSVVLNVNARGAFRRRRRGIVDECCRRGCTIRELSVYCLDRRK